MNYITIGHLSISSTWISALLALFVAFPIYRVLSGKKVGDWYWNAFFLYFLVWKFSYALFNFTLFIHIPLSAVYFNGGIKGHFLAIAAISIYLLFFTIKKYPTIANESPSVFLLYFILFEGISNLFAKSYTEFFSNLLLFAGFIVLHTTLKWNKTAISSQLFILLIMLLLLILSIFHTIFSVLALTIIWVGLTIFILTKKVNQEEN